MKVIAGYVLDGDNYPTTMGQDGASLGIVTVGRNGLISLLETRYGLGAPSDHQAVRIGQYLKRLQDKDDGKQFYSQSLQADQWSTAKQVLAWRDELVSCGWEGKAAKDAPDRLAALSEIENSSSELARGVADRLRRLASKAEAERVPGIREISLVDPMELWPPLYQKLFQELRHAGVTIQDHASPLVDDSLCSNLSILQRAMFQQQASEQTITGDGSLCVLAGSGEWEASQALCEWLSGCRGNHSNMVFIKGPGSRILDAQLSRYSLPRLGHDSTSRWRTALQFLPLVLENHWDPFDPLKLLQILMLPQSPLPRKVARAFESAIREHPGMGGPEWIKALEIAEAYFKEWASAKGLGDKGWKSRLNDLHLWIGTKKFDPQTGIPIDEFCRICKKVETWASVRGGLEDNAHLLGVSAMANSVGAAAKTSGLSSLSRPQVNRIIDAVFGEGIEGFSTEMQAAPWSVVAHPGGIHGPADTIIWWGFNAEKESPIHAPWSKAERQYLTQQGVRIEDSSISRMRQLYHWHRPILWAGKRLILVVPNSGERYHPLWDEIRHLLALEPGIEHQVHYRAAQLREDAKANLWDPLPARVKVPPKSLPPATSRWKIGDISKLLPDGMSYTSMEKLLQCPLAWVLTYIAGLQGGKSAELPGISQIEGILAHHVFEVILNDSLITNANALGEKAGKTFDDAVPQMAAILLHPENTIRKQVVRRAVLHALSNLVSLMKKGKLHVEAMEDLKEKQFDKTMTFRGQIDLLAAESHGDPVIIDLKWSKSGAYKREAMEKHEALQLAAYSWLISKKGTFSPAGYYMIQQAELYISDCQHFPAECIVNSDLKQTWEAARKGFKAQLKNLLEGIALARGIDADAELEEMDDDCLILEPNCGFCSFPNLCQGAMR